MDSNETLDLQDQTSADENQGNNQEQFIEINWEQISLDELKKGYLRQSDYTRKTQELAKEREQSMRQSNDDEPDDVKAAEAFLKSKGYLTKAEMDALLEAKLKAQKDEITLEKIIDANPTLKQHEEAIRKIAQIDNSAIEDIVVKYNFITTDKLSKAKANRDLVWGWTKEQSEKVDISSMTPEQWEAYKKKTGIGKKWMFVWSNSRSL